MKMETQPIKIPNWFHWQIYKLFRWFWNPILKDNRPIRIDIGQALLGWNVLKQYEEGKHGECKMVRQMISTMEMPEICDGGFLDEDILYKGNPALRKADSVECRPNGVFVMIRYWQLGKFDPEIYPPKPNQ